MRLRIILILLLPTLFACGQKYKPSIVILDPYERKYDSLLMTEIHKFDFEGYSTSEDEKIFNEQLKDKPENVRIMETAEWKFREKKDFASMVTMSYQGMVSYLIYGQTEECLIIPIHEKSSGQTDELMAITKKYGVRWIINPISIQVYLKGNDKRTTVRLQIFDSQKRKIMLDKEYTGDTSSPGMELSCEEGTLDCTINNILNQSLTDILTTIL